MLSACWLIGAYFLAVSSHKLAGAWYLSVYGRTVSMKVSFHLLRECPLFGESLVPLYTIPYHTKAVGGGGGGRGSLGPPPPPPPPQTNKGPPKAPLNSTVCLINDAAYYTDISLDIFSRGSEQVLLSNQLATGHACSKLLYKGRSSLWMQRTYPPICLAKALHTFH